MDALFPLWGRDTRELARAMIASGLEARATCIDTRKLDRSFAGRSFDEALLRDLPASIDPCGENGEFHTVVTAGPIFAAPIATSVGEIEERDGFAFADIIPK
jgi:diphthamide synthase (EF-2-diphthine--ammonia ligase)